MLVEVLTLWVQGFCAGGDHVLSGKVGVDKVFLFFNNSGPILFDDIEFGSLEIRVALKFLQAVCNGGCYYFQISFAKSEMLRLVTAH